MSGIAFGHPNALMVGRIVFSISLRRKSQLVRDFTLAEKQNQFLL
jgi:hypothetical protein